MNDPVNYATPQQETAAPDASVKPAVRSETISGSTALKKLSEHSRVEELEAENTRLLRLVGELLVVNQQLRERNAFHTDAHRVHES
jgi:hypothetical protein